MKNIIIHSFPFALILLLSCNNGSVEKDKPKAGKEKSTEITDKESTEPERDDGIVGYWKLALETYDDNDNHVLDEGERSKGFSNRYSFRFNADKSCKIMDMFKGHYEVEEKNGKKVLSVYRDKIAGEDVNDPPPDVYIITSLSSNEMVLLETLGNHTFWVFKRS